MGVIYFNSSFSKKEYCEPIEHNINSYKCFIERTINIIERAKICEHDIVAIFFGFGPYTLSHHLFDALKVLNISVWPLGNPKHMGIDLLNSYMKQINPTVVAALPSTLYWLNRVNIASKGVSKILTAGEFISQSGMRHISESFNSEVFDHYGSTELPSMTYTCRSESKIYHLNTGIELKTADDCFLFHDTCTGLYHKVDKNEIDIIYKKCPYCQYVGTSLIVKDRIKYLINKDQLGIGELSEYLNNHMIFEFFYSQKDKTLFVQEDYKERINKNVRNKFNSIIFVKEIPALASGKLRIK